MKITKNFKILAVLAILISGNAQAQDVSLQEQLDDLQKQISLLRRQQELAEEIARNNADKFATVEFGNKGLGIISADRRYGLKIKGHIQADSRNYVDAKNNEADQFLLRAVRPTLDAKFSDNFYAHTAVDFGNGMSRLIDGYGDWRLGENLNLRFGKFKAPLGLESWQGETDTVFMERGLTANLVPFRVVGIALSGEPVPQILSYQLALTNGFVDLGDSNSNSQGSKELSARIFVQPFKNTDWINWQNLGVGLAGSTAQRNGNQTVSDLAAGYNSSAQNIFFTYQNGAFAKGQSSRINPQLWYYNNQLSVLGEYVLTQNTLYKDSSSKTLINKAWTAIFGYVLTGENASFENFKPKADFNQQSQSWGAFEIVLRLSQMNIDSNTFPNFADANISAKAVFEKAIGLNWYLNQNVKISFNFTNNDFKGGAVNNQDRKAENAFLSRLQFKF